MPDAINRIVFGKVSVQSVKQLIRELARHAIAKKGARQSPACITADFLDYPNFDLPGKASWTDFFRVDQKGEEHFASLPVFADALERHRQKYPAIRQASWVERDGHVFMEVPLDSGLPTEFLKSLIDDAWAIVWDKLDANDRMIIDLSDLPYDEPELIDRLIEIYNLNEHRRAIHAIARHAILLPTRQSPEAQIPLGATKIGGRPDLPAETDWPTYGDGKPLAFLAQIDLPPIAKLITPIEGLPSTGLLSVFSVWGWTHGEGDPQTPRGTGRDGEEQFGWTVAIHSPPQATLERRETPGGVNSFKAAAVEPTPILSLPNSRVEPPLAALDWSDDEYERFDEMQSDYRAIQMGHWLGKKHTFAGHHLLGGYALFQQEFPEEVLEKGLAMFLQIGTDSNTKMFWGDGGELTFYVDAEAMRQGCFERIWGTCQGA